jgi:predicted alpha/beta hydrolase family esterase
MSSQEITTNEAHVPKSLILFVHGLGGNVLTTWGKFPEFLRKDTEINNRYSIAFYSFPTSLLRLIPFFRRLPGIRGLADSLATEIRNRYQSYDSIALICHSLGGLIASRYLIDEVRLERVLRVHRLALIAVPNNGATLAAAARLVSWRHPQLAQLCRDADIIRSVNELWGHFEIQSKVLTRYIVGTQDEIVDYQSATRDWGNENVETVNRGHRNITKPATADDSVVHIIKRFLLAERPAVDINTDADPVNISHITSDSVIRPRPILNFTYRIMPEPIRINDNPGLLELFVLVLDNEGNAPAEQTRIVLSVRDDDDIVNFHMDSSTLPEISGIQILAGHDRYWNVFDTLRKHDHCRPVKQVVSADKDMILNAILAI